MKGATQTMNLYIQSHFYGPFLLVHMRGDNIHAEGPDWPQKQDRQGRKNHLGWCWTQAAVELPENMECDSVNESVSAFLFNAFIACPKPK